MTTKISITRDINNVPTYSLQVSDIKYSTELAAGVPESFAIPVTIEKGIVIFSYEPGSSVWVAINNSAFIPVVGPFVLTNSELNPTARNVKGGDVIEMITSQVGIQVQGLVYALQ